MKVKKDGALVLTDKEIATLTEAQHIVKVRMEESGLPYNAEQVEWALLGAYRETGSLKSILHAARSLPLAPLRSNKQ